MRAVTRGAAREARIRKMCANSSEPAVTASRRGMCCRLSRLSVRRRLQPDFGPPSGMTNGVLGVQAQAY